MIKRLAAGVFVSALLATTVPLTTGCSNCSAEIEWSEAGSRIGDTVTVQGPVVGSAYLPDENGSPTFLNLGKDFPSSDRLTIVIWEGDRSEFNGPPEDAFAGSKVVVTGTISEYNGVPQVVVSDPSQIEACG